MCIDIDTDSVIHKHLVKKIDDLDKIVDWRDDGHIHNLVTKYKQDKTERHDWVTTKHDLTMLDSFHISLGKPPQTKEDMEAFKWCETEQISHKDSIPIVGDISLAPICISEKDGKKSAWIPIDPLWFQWAYLWANDPSHDTDYQLNLDQFDSFDHRCDECPVKHLHVSVANKTGKPRDSIARPEDCIIDTITA